MPTTYKHCQSCRMPLKKFPGFLAGLFTKGIPGLERWKGR